MSLKSQVFNFIGGKELPAASGKTLDVFEPATGHVYASVAVSGEKDVNMAVEAAQAAFLNWSRMSVEDRARFLFKIADAIESRLEEFAKAESINTGKPLSLARNLDIPRAISNFRFFASAVASFASEAHTNENSVNYTARTPLGVVACISPWNLPLYLFSWKIAPALAVGNTVVAKPSELTPVTAYLLSQVCADIGLPAGVLNVVHGLGSEAGAGLVAHSGVKGVSFTGGTATGKEISKVIAPQFKKLSLEMGGKNPTIIFADCRYEKMLETVIRSSFLNQGQICLCGSRIFIEKSIYERFKKDFVQKTEALKIGDPLETSTDQGAVISEAHFQKILSYIELAKKEGAKILTGGGAVSVEGRCQKG